MMKSNGLTNVLDISGNMEYDGSSDESRVQEAPYDARVSGLCNVVRQFHSSNKRVMVL